MATTFAPTIAAVIGRNASPVLSAEAPARAGAVPARPARGEGLPARELASRAAASSSLASAHLAKLLNGGLLRAERHGRERHYRIAGRMFDLNWVTRLPNSRALAVTPQGARELRSRFALAVA